MSEIYGLDAYAPREVALRVETVGVAKARLDTLPLLMLGMLAGAFIGLGGLFFVAMDKKTVIGTILAGYDGHRGWLYSVAVHADYRRHGLGSSLVRHAEQALAALGCMKINLQITGGNDTVVGFYEALGYGVEPRISMGKKMVENIPTQS